MNTTDEARLAMLATICLALPETSMVSSGSHASFIVRKKTFVYFLNDHHGDGILVCLGRLLLCDLHAVHDA